MAQDILPPSGSGKYKRNISAHQKIADRLKRRRGEWSVVHKAPNRHAADSWAYRFRHGHMITFDEGHYEAVVRQEEVWARYVGPVVK